MHTKHAWVLIKVNDYKNNACGFIRRKRKKSDHANTVFSPGDD